MKNYRERFLFIVWSFYWNLIKITICYNIFIIHFTILENCMIKFFSFVCFQGFEIEVERRNGLVWGKWGVGGWIKFTANFYFWFLLSKNFCVWSHRIFYKKKDWHILLFTRNQYRSQRERVIQLGGRGKKVRLKVLWVFFVRLFPLTYLLLRKRRRTNDIDKNLT